MTLDGEQVINALKSGVDKFKKTIDGAEKTEPDWDNVLLSEDEQPYVNVDGAYLAEMMRGKVPGIKVLFSQPIGGMGMPLYGIKFERDKQKYQVVYDMNEPLEECNAFLYDSEEI
jgi:hypothetical protein